MDKNFTIDLDLNDSEYRNKFRKLMDDVEKETRRFNQSYSRQEVDSARRRVEYDRQQNPYSNRGRTMSDERDRKIVKEDDNLRQLNRNLEEAQKQQRIYTAQERRRHDEYRSMTSKQLEIEQKKIQKSLTEAERSGDGGSVGQRSRDLQAIRRERALRGAGGSAQDDTVRRLGSHIFMNQLFGGLMTGRMGEYYGGTFRAGMSGYSMARTGGAGVGGSLAAGGITLAIAGIIKLFQVGEELQKTYLQNMRKIGTSDILSQHHSVYRNEFNSMGISRKGYSELISPFLESTMYTGSSQEMGSEILKQQRIERVLGIKSSQLGGLYTGGGFGNDRVDVEKTTVGLAKFLESQNIAGVKLGIGAGGKIEDRNLVRVPEYLQKLIEINEGIYRVTGEKSEEQQKEAAKMFGAALGMGGVFQRADTAAELVKGIQQSFASPKSPLHEFYNIQAYRQVSGRTSLHDMKMSMENMTDPRVMNQLVSNTRGMYGFGGGELDTSKDIYTAYIGRIQSLTGMSYTKAAEFDKMFGQKGGFTESDLGKFIEKDPQQAYIDAATKFSTAAEVAKTSLETGFQSFGESVQKFGESVMRFVEAISFTPSEKTKSEAWYDKWNFKQQQQQIVKDDERRLKA